MVGWATAYKRWPSMSNKSSNNQESTERIEKELKDCDKTSGYHFGHYSHNEVAASMHASEGQSHE
jgi:putative salt-induced outer membrane protein YdiY